MQIIINPGSGPVNDATEKNATENMKHFVTDHDENGLMFVRVPEHDYGQGRYAFLMYKHDSSRYHEIQMPGFPLESVRYVDSESQNISNFPRLYVDGSSYVWKYAILNENGDWTEPE